MASVRDGGIEEDLDLDLGAAQEFDDAFPALMTVAFSGNPHPAHNHDKLEGARVILRDGSACRATNVATNSPSQSSLGTAKPTIDMTARSEAAGSKAAIAPSNQSGGMVDPQCAKSAKEMTVSDDRMVVPGPAMPNPIEARVDSATIPQATAVDECASIEAMLRAEIHALRLETAALRASAAGRPQLASNPPIPYNRDTKWPDPSAHKAPTSVKVDSVKVDSVKVDSVKVDAGTVVADQSVLRRESPRRPRLVIYGAEGSLMDDIEELSHSAARGVPAVMRPLLGAFAGVHVQPRPGEAAQSAACVRQRKGLELLLLDDIASKATITVAAHLEPSWSVTVLRWLYQERVLFDRSGKRESANGHVPTNVEGDVMFVSADVRLEGLRCLMEHWKSEVAEISPYVHAALIRMLRIEGLEEETAAHVRRWYEALAWRQAPPSDTLRICTIRAMAVRLERIRALPHSFYQRAIAICSGQPPRRESTRIPATGAADALFCMLASSILSPDSPIPAE
jgi:hypothetical protein